MYRDISEIDAIAKMDFVTERSSLCTSFYPSVNADVIAHVVGLADCRAVAASGIVSVLSDTYHLHVLRATPLSPNFTNCIAVYGIRRIRV